MEPTDASVEDFLEQVTPAKRKRDADTLMALMERVTGEPARMWGPSIVGFGHYHYRYESGREGDAGAAGFSPRKASSVVYLPDGTGSHTALLEQLGPHTTGVSCLYIKDLAAVDLEVLEEIVGRSYATMTDGVYTKRAREGGQD